MARDLSEHFRAVRASTSIRTFYFMETRQAVSGSTNLQNCQIQGKAGVPCAHETYHGPLSPHHSYYELEHQIDDRPYPADMPTKWPHVYPPVPRFSRKEGCHGITAEVPVRNKQVLYQHTTRRGGR